MLCAAGFLPAEDADDGDAVGAVGGCDVVFVDSDEALVEACGPLIVDPCPSTIFLATTLSSFAFASKTTRLKGVFPFASRRR